MKNPVEGTFNDNDCGGNKPGTSKVEDFNAR